MSSNAEPSMQLTAARAKLASSSNAEPSNAAPSNVKQSQRSPTKLDEAQRSSTNAAERREQSSHLSETAASRDVAMDLRRSAGHRPFSTRNEQDSVTLSTSGSASGNAPALKKTPRSLAGWRAALSESCAAAPHCRLQKRPRTPLRDPIATHWDWSHHVWLQGPASSSSHEPARHRESEA